METTKTSRRKSSKLNLFPCLILHLPPFPIFSLPPNLNDAISRKAENYIACTKTCCYSKTLYLSNSAPSK